MNPKSHKTHKHLPNRRQRHHPLQRLGLAAACVLPMAAGAQGTPASGSSVTVYGIVDAATRYSTNANANRDSLVSMEDGIFTGSRLGFRGREDLGSGLSAVYTLESGFDVSTGASLQATPTADYGQTAANPRFWGREVHVGLRSTWGGITLGRQYTLAHTLAIRFQPLGNPNSTAHSLYSSHHIARQDNVLRVDTRLAGVDLSATRTFGEQAGSDANSSWALGAGYTAGSVSLAAYVQQMDNLAGSETRKIVGAGGNYKLNPMFTLYAAAMQRRSETSPQKNRVWSLGANVELSPAITLSLARYADKQTGSTALQGERTVSWVSASYRLSRRSDVYAVLDNNHVTGGYTRPAFMGNKGSQTGVVLGLRHRF
jgi:predicted porin